MEDTKVKTDKKMEKSPHYSPFWMAVANVIIAGIGYLFMREYKRFFVLYAIAFALILLPIPYVSLIILAYIGYDAYVITKKANKTGQRPAYDKSKHIGGTMLIILYIVITIGLSVTFY